MQLTTIKKSLMGVAALGALALGGSQIAAAAGVGSERADGSDDQPVTGAAAQQATRAAESAVPGAKAGDVEADDLVGAAYEVELTRPDKSTVSVHVSKDGKVVGQDKPEAPEGAEGAEAPDGQDGR